MEKKRRPLQSARDVNRFSVVMRDHTWLPTVTVLDGVVDATTCADLLAAANGAPWTTLTPSHGLGPAVVARRDEVVVEPRHTRLADPRLALRVYLRLTERLPDRIGLLERGPLSAGLDVVRYDVGEASSLHVDAHLDDPWQRIPMVALLCLEAPERGGETVFPASSMAVEAVRGRVIVFRADLPHHGDTVSRGRKTMLRARFDYDASFDR
jgi:hypothetical protein